jgi:putative heme iron utilization protein
MDPVIASTLRQLLDTQPVAALATLHRGEPAVSMVPFVLPAGAIEIVLHVSALSTHTRDMLEHPRVGLMVMADARAGTPPQALPRVSLQAVARQLPPDGDEQAQARAHYLARFPQSANTFELADFSLFALHPVSARLIAGFGQAYSVVERRLVEWLAQAR